MIPNTSTCREDRNRARLATEIDALREMLGVPRPESDANVVGPETPHPDGDDGHIETALDVLSRLFGLTAFERATLLLCAAVELDGGMARAVRKQSGAGAGGEVTFALALALLPEPHWSALPPSAPLRRWQLVELGPATSLVAAPLCIDERILHFLLGVRGADERLLGLLKPIATAGNPADSRRAVAEQVIGFWNASIPAAEWPLIELNGPDPEALREVAAQAAAALSINAVLLASADIPAAATERDALSVLVQREAALSRAAILIEFDSDWPAGRAWATAAFVDSLAAPVILLSPESLRLRTVNPTFRLAVDALTAEEQRALWERALGDAVGKLDGELDQALQQFRLDTRGIRAGGAQVRASLERDRNAAGILWRSCRSQSRARLEDLAQRIRPRADWSRLVLPDSQTTLLRQIALQMRQRSRVYADWGFEKLCSRGLGINALFAGPSGTGKTMAAEVLARELDLDLYRIDLSQVVSKYIGETEKNLHRVFDAAEDGGAILLFDEADALFGKRSEVKDSHDRYANIEVSYLLQRMEEYRGIAILTTNQKDALDRSFLRRLRFIVTFPFPDAEQRVRIWRGIFPGETPTAGLDIKRLAQLNIAGGNIRNIALNAAFLAADRGGPVRHDEIRRAAHHEYGKLDKTLSERELRGWP